MLFIIFSYHSEVLLTAYLLQEGMFNNANVIFRTKFVDGVSTVSRTIGSGASQRPRGALTAENSQATNDKAKKRRGGRSETAGKENTVGVEA